MLCVIITSCCNLFIYFIFTIFFFVFSHSAGGDSWDSSGDEDDNMFGSKAKVCTYFIEIHLLHKLVSDTGVLGQ